MVSPLARRVARAVGRGLWGDGDRVAVAVSGGPDSVALAWLLAELAPRARWSLVGLIHVNHGLRGAESDADEQFCRDLAARLALPVDVTRAEVAARAASDRRSIEATARDLRYAAFAAAAERLDVTVVVTGHTRDDQAETVLLRLLRGATMRGVSAIRRRRGLYARPLLGCRRAALRAHLHARAESFREDSSNADQAIPRNHLRLSVLPAIEAQWPGGVSALARFAGLAADDERVLAAEALGAAGGPIHSGPSGVEVKRGPIATLPAALSRRVVRDAIESAGGHPSYRDVEAVRRLARADNSKGRLMLHGLAVERDADLIRLRLPGGGSGPGPFAHPLPVPGLVSIPETGDAIRATRLVADSRPVGGRCSAAVQAGALALPLTVRNRRPGDRFRPLGAPGSRKLQDVLVDRRVPAAERDRVPVVVDAAGRIVWVAGVVVAHGCRVTVPQAGMVILDLDEKTKDNQ